MYIKPETGRETPSAVKNAQTAAVRGVAANFGVPDGRGCG